MYKRQLDLSRATDIHKLVVTEGWDTGVNLGSLTVVGIRNGADLRLEGGFSKPVNLHYGQGLTGTLNVELALGDVTADINLLNNASVLNIDSQGIENQMHSFFAGGSISRMNVTGAGIFAVDENLADSFNAGRPVIIDASANTGGLDVTLMDGTGNPSGGSDHGFYNVTVRGTQADDEITVTNIATATHNGKVVITAGNGDNTVVTDGSDIVSITSGTGDDYISSTSSVKVTIDAGDGANVVNTNSSKIVNITTGAGNDTITATNGNSVTIAAGDGNNAINADQSVSSSYFGTATVSITTVSYTHLDVYKRQAV